MVQTTTKFTYHDIIDSNGHVFKTELVSKVRYYFFIWVWYVAVLLSLIQHTSEEVLSKTTDTKVSYNELNLWENKPNKKTRSDSSASDRLSIRTESSTKGKAVQPKHS